MTTTRTSVHTIETIPRFTEQDHGYHVWFMDVLDTGLLAVAGLSMKTKNTFVDLFMFQYNPDSQENPLLLTPKPYFSQEFIVCGSAGRSVCLLDDRLFLTCCEDTIALYDSSNGGLVNQGKFNGQASCMTTRDSLVYVCLISRKVIVLDARELSKDRKITLKGLGVKEWPIDITVSNNKLFICTGWYWRALMCNSEGEIEQEYINTQYSLALSITVSEEKGLIFILWNDGGEGSQVVAYSLSGGHSSISEGHSSISGGHILASFKVPDNSCRIRINNNINRLFLVTWKTGELYEYHISDIFTVDNLLKCSKSIIEKNDCKKLLDYFDVPSKDSKDIIKSDAPFLSVIHHLTEAGMASVDDISHLMTACSEKGLSQFAAVLTVYQKAQVIQKVLKDQQKALENKRQELSHKLTESEDEKQHLTVRLKTTEEERQQFKDALKTTEEERQQLIGILKTTEEERQQFKDALKVTEEEGQHLTGRLKTTEEESQQCKDALEAKEEERQQLNGRLKTTEEERQQRNDILKATEEERQLLNERLKTTEEERQQFRDRLNTTEYKLKTLNDEKDELLQQQKEELEGAKSSLRATKDELVKSQLEYAKESMALQEVLKQTREALNQKQLVSSASITEEETLLAECETPDVSQESILAADYGRLMVNVADDLTLDSTLKLATLFGLPPAETDMLRRVSLIETPGITLINFMKARNIINMYDNTNLQKGLVYIHLNRTNEYLLAPYQSKVDPFQVEENQAPKLLDWPVENVKSVPDDESTPSQGTGEREETKDHDHDHDHDHSKESLMEGPKREELPKQRKDSKILEMRHHHSYIEHMIKYEGGTISIMGVHLTIPEGALSYDRVIAVKVIYDPTIHLPGSAGRGRMTPLIKLEPKGLVLNKPAQLTIPHSAIIPEPDRHGVIIFTGLKDEETLQKGEITWTEEKSIGWKLDPEKISLDINILSYVFVNLVSQDTEQKHIFRIVPFIDGILDAKDDVLITVCFCKDSDEEYKLLLEDHQSKLSLGNYTTFQVTRILNDDRDCPPYINLMMSSPGDSYHLMKEESTKHVDIDHLCAASRVSHQFRLKRNNDGYTAMVDVKLKVSQREKNQTALILQSKVKNILLSPESQEILFRELHPDLHKYEKLRGDIAKLLDKQHCKKLGVYFELKPAENETIQTAAESGKMLMKILDERELITPDRMIGMYEGLKAIQFNKVARLVLEYSGTSQEKNGKEKEREKDDKKNVKFPEKQEFISKREPKLSINFKTLIEEGYKRLDIQRALKLSHGKLDLGRRLLLLAKEEHERLSLFPGSNLYKEQYFDQSGGEMFIAGVCLRVPAGALHTGRIVSLWVSADPAIKGPISNKSLRLTPFVKFGPESLTLHKPVSLIIPHCAFTTTNQMGIDVYSGVLQTDKSVKWSLERKHLSCSMNSQRLAVEAEKPCLIGLHIPFIPKMRKRVCLLPIVNRVSESGDRLTIHLWFHNDDTLEHESLINEEIYQQKGTIIHDPVSVVLKSMTSMLHFSANSSTSQCNPHPRKVDVAMKTIWFKNRHEVVFHLQNKGIKDTVNLEIKARYELSKKNLFQFSIQLQFDKLLHFAQITSPFHLVLPETFIKSFDQLKQNLSEYLDVDQSTLLANIFQIPEEGINDIKKHKTPGILLLEELTKNSLISPTNITKLENALTEQGNEKCAKLLREFRNKNHVVEATMCPE
ncbi:uncharacterized protein [Apostichopus japonicus]|uniref:uncharacterized protein isoform X2 n=1 Tax=Stichopus japonicus TaxID=307972 RepID=UPI003AB572C7